MSIPIGAQLYTLRNQLQAPEEIEKTLARVAKIGYKYIQCSGFDFDAVWLRALCDRLGLKIRLTHVRGPGNRILEEPQGVIEEHKILGCPYVGLGGMGREYYCAGGAQKFIDDYTPAMKAFAEAGLKFQYHNHSGEFERFGSNETLFAELIRLSDPALLGFTLDTYWVQHGGVDVADLIRRMKGRIDVCHYKDYAIVEGKPRFAAIGEGNLNWPAIIAAFEEIGCKYAFIEQDDCYGKDPLEELAVSFRFLESSK